MWRFSTWTQRSYELVHNMRNGDPLRNHRVIPRLSTGIDRLFHFPTFRCVITCLSRMRGTSHPETGPKRPSNPPRPCQARVAPAKAAQGQRSLRTQGLRARTSGGVGHSVRGDAAKRRKTKDSMSRWLDTVRRRSGKATNQYETPLRRGFSFLGSRFLAPRMSASIYLGAASAVSPPNIWERET